MKYAKTALMLVPLSHHLELVPSPQLHNTVTAGGSDTFKLLRIGPGGYGGGRLGAAPTAILLYSVITFRINVINLPRGTWRTASAAVLQSGARCGSFRGAAKGAQGVRVVLATAAKARGVRVVLATVTSKR